MRATTDRIYFIQRLPVFFGRVDPRRRLYGASHETGPDTQVGYLSLFDKLSELHGKLVGTYK